MTALEAPNGDGEGPPNRFSHVRRLSTPDADKVVAPNEDTLYSIAWLNLRRQPLVLRVPRVGKRYFVLPLMDPYTEDFKNLGSVRGTRPGDYVISGPGSGKLALPRGVRRIRSPHDRVWIIGRTEVRGPDDVRRVRRIQRRYRLTPLRRWRRSGHRPPARIDRSGEVEQRPLPSGLAYLDRLGRQLLRFPPPREDRPQLKRLAEVGIGPGRTPSADPGLTTDQRRGLIDAVADGPGSVLVDLRAAYALGFADHNGWLVERTGRYGTDYRSRATTAQVGLGALIPREAIYPFAQVDSTGLPLTGSERYLIRFEPGELPPAKAFWSLTMYDTGSFFVPNPLGRFAINDRTALEYGPDGSLELYVQAQRPTDPAVRRNWLPAPTGPFRLITRIYQPRRTAIRGILRGDGWRPPTIMRLP
jgi:hypothetical protein